MDTVLFWRDIEGDKELFEPYQKQIQQLKAGEYTNLTLERLDDEEYPLYTIRASKEKRILFTTRNGNVFLLDVIENHDHQKCRFLRNANVLPAYMQKVAAKLKKDPNKFTLCTKVTDLEEQSSQGPIQFRGIEFHNQQLIHFTDEQECARSIKTPAVGLGPAGTGKTSVALSMALKHVRQGMNNNDSDQRPVLILSRSARLIDQTREYWEKLVTDPNLQKQVAFLTLEELALRKNPNAKLTEGYEDFVSWYKSKKIKLEYNLERVWLEFRIASGYTADEYAALGNKQSCTFVPEDKRTEARKEIYGLFDQYLTYLKTNNLTDIELNFPEGTDDFSLVLFDEAQDGTCDQLKKAKAYAENANIVYFLGDHQILFDGKSRLTYLRNLYHGLGIKLSEQRLTGTFRCPQAVIDVANQIIVLKHNLVGGAADKGESRHLEVASTANKDPGEIKWLSTTADMSEYYNQGITLAVITSPEFIEEAKLKFGTALVFTPAQIKGLEFERIVMWKPFETKMAYNANKLLASQTIVADHLGHRAKNGQSREEFLPFCDELTTGVTRSKIQLLMVQDSSHETEHLVNFVKPVFVQTATNSTAKLEFTSANTTDDWQKEAIRQRNMGNTSQADAIENRLNSASTSFGFFSPAVSTSSTTKTAHTPAKVAAGKKDANGPAKNVVQKPTNLTVATPSTTTAVSLFTEENMIKLLDNFLKKGTQNIDGLVKLINANPETSLVFLRCLANFTRFNELPIEEMLKCKLNKVLGQGLKDIHAEYFLHMKNRSQAGNKELDDGDITPVMFAAMLGLDKAIRVLHKYGANINAKDINGGTALHYAVSNQRGNCLKLLIDLKADLTAKRVNGTTLVHSAIIDNNTYRKALEILKILKDSGVDLNVEDARGLTPAAMAAINDDYSTLKGLKKLDVDLNQLDSSGFGLVHYAIFCRNPQVLSVLKEVGIRLNQCSAEQVDISNTMKRLKIKPLKLSDKSITPIEAATQLGDKDLVEKLVDLGVDPLQKIRLDVNLAHIAAGFGRDDVLIYLYGQKINLSEQSSSTGSTTTHCAGDGNHIDCLMTLKRLEVPYNVANNYGFTPLISAIWNNAQLSVDFFVQEYPGLKVTPWVFSRSKLQAIPATLLPKHLLQTLEENLNEIGKTDDEVSLLPHELATMLGNKVMSLMIEMSENGIIRQSKKIYPQLMMNM